MACVRNESHKAGHAITSGHRTISDQFMQVSGHVRFSTVNMSERREAPKKRAVLTTTVEKWAVENDKSLNTAVWLKFDVDPANRTRVMSLKCSVCSRFREKLTGMRNYNAAFVEGSVNLRVSSVKDHAGSDMHSRAMLLLKKQVRVPVLSCSMHTCAIVGRLYTTCYNAHRGSTKIATYK